MMLISYELEKNRRQIPKTSEYLKLKTYCDYLYGYLQVNSSYDETTKTRYILKKDCKYTDIAKDLGISRQTVSKKFNDLKTTGLIKEDEINNRFILVTLEKEIAELIPFSTLRILSNTVQDKVISVYVYLLVRFRAEKQKSFRFTLSQIKSAVGVGESRSTDYIISDILTVLQKLGLLKYEGVTEFEEGVGYKYCYHILDMNNKIEEADGSPIAESIQKC